MMEDRGSLGIKLKIPDLTGTENHQAENNFGRRFSKTDNIEEQTDGIEEDFQISDRMITADFLTSFDNSNIKCLEDQLRGAHELSKNIQSERNHEPGRATLSGVGLLLKELRGEIRPPQKERITLDELGYIWRNRSKFPVCRIKEVQESITCAAEQDGIAFSDRNDPTDPRIVRKLIRNSMIRCKVCKNRFAEKNIYERHLRDKHPQEFSKFIQAQEEEIEALRQFEFEENRLEELRTGSFVPPENEVALHYPTLIPLPGEEKQGLPSSRFGYRRRRYIKKISPQCPFCDKRFRNDVSLKNHIRKTHEEGVEYKQCLKCFKCVLDDADMAKHDCEMTYICFQCSPIRNMYTEHRLIKHRAKFHRGANSGFRCDTCNAKFLTPRTLRKHKKMSHFFNRTFKCHFCDEHFVSMTEVTKHERVHTGYIKFECRVCDFKANRCIEMENHNKNEHGYVCPICEERCAENSEMKHHVYTVHGGYLAADEPIAYIASPRTWMLYKGE